MARYIDKDGVIAGIKKLKDNAHPNSDWNHGYVAACDSILSFLDTLEVKEEILDKKSKTNLMRKCVHKAYKRGYDMGVLQTTNKMKHNAKEADLDKELFDWYNKEKNTDYNASILYEKYNNTLKKLVKHFFKN